jgi:hypothetical protein
MSPLPLAVAWMLVTLAAPVPDETSGYRWKLEKERTFYQETTIAARQQIKIMDQETVQSQNQVMVFSWTPLRQEGTSWVLRQKIEGIRIVIDLGGARVEYDSTRPGGADNPLSAFFNNIVGTEFLVTLDKDMRVTRIAGHKELVARLIADNPPMESLIESTLSEAALKEMTEPMFAALPPRALERGESWVRSHNLDMGPAGRYRMAYEYVQDGKDGALVRFKIGNIDFKYEPPANNDPKAPFTINRANLSGKKGSGRILFDPEKGRIALLEMSLEIQGDMDVGIGGQNSRVELQQTQKTIVRIMDDNPLKR